MRSRGLVLAGGQGSLTGKLFRVGHLGAVSVDDILRSLEILEEAAVAIGVPVTRGVTTTAAAEAAKASATAEARTPVLAQPA